MNKYIEREGFLTRVTGSEEDLDFSTSAAEDGVRDSWLFEKTVVWSITCMHHGAYIKIINRFVGIIFIINNNRLLKR